MQTREIRIFFLVSRTFCLFVPTLGACIEVFYPFFCAKLGQLNRDGVKKSSFRMSGTQGASGNDFNNKEKLPPCLMFILPKTVENTVL